METRGLPDLENKIFFFGEENHDKVTIISSFVLHFHTMYFLSSAKHQPRPKLREGFKINH